MNTKTSVGLDWVYLLDRKTWFIVIFLTSLSIPFLKIKLILFIFYCFFSNVLFFYSKIQLYCLILHLPCILRFLWFVTTSQAFLVFDSLVSFEDRLVRYLEKYPLIYVLCFSHCYAGVRDFQEEDQRNEQSNIHAINITNHWPQPWSPE
jgi:hypothetical protein